jgi:hypothetical protein
MGTDHGSQMTEYAEKLRSIGFGTKRGQDEKRRVVDERTAPLPVS